MLLPAYLMALLLDGKNSTPSRLSVLVELQGAHRSEVCENRPLPFISHTFDIVKDAADATLLAGSMLWMKCVSPPPHPLVLVLAHSTVPF